jgi:hypothetical protein
MKDGTLGMVIDGIKYGNIDFGNTLECGVPYQKPTYNNELEYQISDY